jgi:hypothetical protein
MMNHVIKAPDSESHRAWLLEEHLLAASQGPTSQERRLVDRGHLKFDRRRVGFEDPQQFVPRFTSVGTSGGTFMSNSSLTRISRNHCGSVATWVASLPKLIDFS